MFPPIGRLAPRLRADERRGKRREEEWRRRDVKGKGMERPERRGYAQAEMALSLGLAGLGGEDA